MHLIYANDNDTERGGGIPDNGISKLPLEVVENLGGRRGILSDKSGQHKVCFIMFEDVEYLIQVRNIMAEINRTLIKMKEKPIPRFEYEGIWYNAPVSFLW
jgi:hypothetical protein